MIARIVCCALLLAGPRLRADVGLILSEPTAEGASIWTSAGHASIYLSRICPESPVKMRLCRPGESGSVLTNYRSFAENAPYQWNVAPFNVFLYGVEDARNRPLYAFPALRLQLQERFRRRYLAESCFRSPCAGYKKAHWRDMVAANFVREVYIFRVRTTLDQDLSLMARFNALPNENRFNGLTHNCADFARSVINTYFPDAARRDRINDFGLTSPKAISKSFSHYAERHPDLEFQVLRFAQIPGHYRPSTDSRKGTEVAFRSKKWLFPMLLKSHELGIFAASYLLTGRFNPDHELRRWPDPRIARIDEQIAQARSRRDQQRLRQLQAERREVREAIIGSRKEWKSYAASFHRLVDQAMEKGLIASRKELRRTLRDLDLHSTALIDENGAVWLDMSERGVVRRAGISAGNINVPGSDPELAYMILLARMDWILGTPRKSRELMPQFAADWALLEDTRARLDWPAEEIKVASGGGSTAKGAIKSVAAPAPGHDR